MCYIDIKKGRVTDPILFKSYQNNWKMIRYVATRTRNKWMKTILQN